MMFEPSRTAALARLAEFLPRAGKAYAETRNFDDGWNGNCGRQNVSQLSPWLHAGLIGESEVIEGVLAQHGQRNAEAFISEVFWRVYFKGYLEQRPSIWRAYCSQRDAALAAVDRNAGLRTAYSDAVEGRTGIAAFDHWARELVETGYLHNHARMWFASIWIFTLKLDWTLGADFFLRYLIDGDAASNTLSWRWVAGLHTKGKTYLARADNIARYTANMQGGPLATEGLAEEAHALVEAEEHGRRSIDLPRPLNQTQLREPFALLLHDEAASHVPLNLPAPPALVIGAARPEARSPHGASKAASHFARSAVEGGLRDAAQAFGCEAAIWTPEASLAEILNRASLECIVVPYLPTGWTRDTLMPQLHPLVDGGHAATVLDDLNRITWPHAKAGFFGVKKQIDGILSEVGLACG